MISAPAGKYVPKEINTTAEAIAALSPIEQQICAALIKAGDIKVVERKAKV